MMVPHPVITRVIKMVTKSLDYPKIFPMIELYMEQVGECNQGDQYDKHQVADGTCYVS